MLSRFQEILLRDKLHRRLISLLGPPEDPVASYLDDVGSLVDLFRTKLSPLSPPEAVRELSEYVNSGDGADIPLPALEQLHTLLVTYDRAAPSLLSRHQPLQKTALIKKASSQTPRSKWCRQRKSSVLLN